MKKVLSIVLAVAMLFAVCIPAFAVTITPTDPTPAADGTQSKDSRVYTDTTGTPVDGGSYTVTIPAETKITWGENSTLVQYSYKSQLTTGKTLSISITGKNAGNDPAADNYMLNATDATTKLYYTFSKEGIEGEAVIGYTPNVEVNTTKNRTFNIDVTTDNWNAVPVDLYEDNLTFTVSVIDIVTA